MDTLSEYQMIRESELRKEEDDYSFMPNPRGEDSIYSTNTFQAKEKSQDK